MALEMEGIRNCYTVKKARAWLDERGSGEQPAASAGVTPQVIAMISWSPCWERSNLRNS